MHITGPNTPDAQQAELLYRTLNARPNLGRIKTLSTATLVEIQLLTGRKHQIRVQLAHAGHPIVGDLKYGSQTKFSSGIALHSRRLVLEHPVRKTPLTIEAPLPRSWQSIV
jgi:23S rRNA pseudouridine1911/1915/1917 synthase